MKKFRIKIDLSAFFGDERKLAYILVDPKWESVKCLQMRVEEIFELQNVWFTTDEGCFVPPQESIQVVKSDDVLKAFTLSEGLTKKKHKKTKESREHINGLVKETLLHQETTPDTAEGVKQRRSKTRKFHSLETGFTSSTPNEVKRSKNVLTAATRNNTVNEITSTNEQLGLLRQEQQQLKLRKSRHLGLHAEQPEQPVSGNTQCQDESSEGVTKKRKRKRNNSNEEASSLIQDDIKEKPVEVVNEAAYKTFATEEIRTNYDSTLTPVPPESNEKASLQNQSSKSVHDECNETVHSVQGASMDEGEEETPGKVMFFCSLSNASFDKPRVFSLNQTIDINSATIAESEENKKNKPEKLQNCTEKYINSPIIIQENVIIPPSVSSANISTESLSKDHDEKFSAPAPAPADATMEQSEHESTGIADDSSIIAIESECDDDDEEDHIKQLEGDGTQVSEVIDLNASDDESQTENVSRVSNHSRHQSIKSGENLSITKMLPFSINLELLPAIGEIVIFKLVRVDGKKSKFIAGKCEYINKRTKHIKLRVIDGQAEVKGISSKYICSLDDSTVADEQILQIKYPDMIDAKVFSIN